MKGEKYYVIFAIAALTAVCYIATLSYFLALR